MTRLSLGNDPEAAGALADQLTARLDEIWRHDPKADIDLHAVIAPINDDPETLTDWQAEYLRLKPIDPDPTKTAASALRDVAGDKDIRSYDRRDTCRFVHALEARGLRSRTIRRRIASISAVINGRNGPRIRPATALFVLFPWCCEATRRAAPARAGA